MSSLQTPTRNPGSSPEDCNAESPGSGSGSGFGGRRRRWKKEAVHINNADRILYPCESPKEDVQPSGYSPGCELLVRPSGCVLQKRRPPPPPPSKSQSQSHYQSQSPCEPSLLSLPAALSLNEIIAQQELAVPLLRGRYSQPPSVITANPLDGNRGQQPNSSSSSCSSSSPISVSRNLRELFPNLNIAYLEAELGASFHVLPSAAGTRVLKALLLLAVPMTDSDIREVLVENDSSNLRSRFSNLAFVYFYLMGRSIEYTLFQIEVGAMRSARALGLHIIVGGTQSLNGYSIESRAPDDDQNDGSLTTAVVIAVLKILGVSVVSVPSKQKATSHPSTSCLTCESVDTKGDINDSFPATLTLLILWLRGPQLSFFAWLQLQTSTSIVHEKCKIHILGIQILFHNDIFEHLSDLVSFLY